jgi:hypothetical protein
MSTVGGLRVVCETCFEQKFFFRRIAVRVWNQLWLLLLSAVLTLAANAWCDEIEPPASSNEEALKRITEDIKYLSSDALAGRKPGSEGIEVAAKYIETEYKRIGLKPLDDGTYRQDFEVRLGTTVDPSNTYLKWIPIPDSEKGADDAMDNAGPWDLEYAKDFVTQASRRGFNLEAELVFVGYGIDAEDELNYNDYRGVDVKDKIVVLIRREPQQGDENSVFSGKEISPYSYLNGKTRQARRAGAAGIIMVNDGYTATDEEKDVLEDSALIGGSLPFIQVKRKVLNALLEKSPLTHPNGSKLTNLSEIEKHIDGNLSPLSQPIRGWKVSTASKTHQNNATTSNIVGFIPGQGPLAGETIIIGGHYDHLGMGGFGSRVNRREIHNGADDNATGTAAVMELARRFAQRPDKPTRTLMFICFSAEEMGLLGAYHYVEHPLVPLADTNSMVNFDMIGWLRNDKVTVFNADSAPEFDSLLDSANQSFNLDVEKSGGFGGSDHLPFYQKQIPVMFIHTGLTSTYHTPEDDFETIDCDGALRVIDYSEKVIDGLLALETRPQFETGGRNRGPSRVRLGISMEDETEEGVKISRVLPDSVAEKNDFRPGDLIVGIGTEKTTNRREVNRLVRSNSGKTVMIKLKRGSEILEKMVEIKE